MWYTITILSVICCTYLPVTPLRAGNDAVKGHSIECETGFILPDVPHRSCLLAQAGKATAPEKKESGPDKEDRKPEEGKQPGEPPQQKDKKPPLKDFVPSEKIDADKAVDFPADI